MDPKVLEALVGPISAQDISVMDITAISVRLYEETLKAMGLKAIPVNGVTVDNSQVQYAAPLNTEAEYADLPTTY